MTNEELAVVARGNTERLAELWEQVRRFVAREAIKRYKATGGFGGVTVDDLIQSGFLALAAAVESFNPLAGQSFIGWLALHLKTAFSMAGGYHNRKQKQDPLHGAASLDLPIGEDGGGTLGDLQEDPSGMEGLAAVEDRIFNEQLHKALDKALASLTEEQEETIRARYYQGRTLRDIAAEHGVAVEMARQWESKAMASLQHPKRIRELEQYIEDRTPYYLCVGVAQFNTTRTSAVEKIVILREDMQQRAM